MKIKLKDILKIINDNILGIMDKTTCTEYRYNLWKLNDVDSQNVLPNKNMLDYQVIELYSGCDGGIYITIIEEE